jgi:glycosyltransferase involved in cell wall biosynthesis
MIEEKRLAVVVPAFNEGRWIERVLGTLPPFVDLVVVVDDASHDDTRERAARAVSQAERLIVCHDENRGVGAAIVTGYRHALARGADIVAVMAGDGQMDPADLLSLALPVARGEADYLKGNRLAHPSFRAMPRWRRAGTWALGRLTSWAAGIDVGDSQCGYTAASRRALEVLALDALWPRYGYPNDLLGALAAAGMRIAERPVRAVYQGQASGLRPWHGVVILGLVARTALRRMLADPAPLGHAPSLRPAP